jgi:hypothetical protein
LHEAEPDMGVDPEGEEDESSPVDPVFKPRPDDAD